LLGFGTARRRGPRGPRVISHVGMAALYGPKKDARFWSARPTKNKTRRRRRVRSNFGSLSTMSSNPFRQRPMTGIEVSAGSTGCWHRLGDEKQKPAGQRAGLVLAPDLAPYIDKANLLSTPRSGQLPLTELVAIIALQRGLSTRLLAAVNAVNHEIGSRSLENPRGANYPQGYGALEGPEAAAAVTSSAGRPSREPKRLIARHSRSQ
jgi:hypothetical protein